MTVQELIDKLEEVPDKSLEIGAGFGKDYYTHNIDVQVLQTEVELS